MNNILSQNINANKIFIIHFYELKNRLDPIFYSAGINKFTSFFQSVPLNDIATNLMSGCGAGKQEQSDEFNGIIQIRPTNIDADGFLKYDKNIFVSELKFKENIDIDDILFNNTNSQELVGKSAILKEGKKLSFSNHITRIRVDKTRIIPDYLWIILNMYQRNRIFYSICTNWNNQSGVGLNLLRALRIPLPPIEIQKKIVDIYKLANQKKQQKETMAEKLLASIDEYLLSELGISLPEKDNSLKNRIFTVRFNEISGRRLDPDYQNLYYRTIEKKIEKSKFSMILLKDVVEYMQSGKTPAYMEYSDVSTKYPIIKAGSYTEDYIDLKKCDYTLTAQYLEVKKGDIFILSAAHQAEYVGKHIKYLNEEPEIKTSFVGELICVRSSERYNSVFLFSLLGTNIYKTLINREKTGQTSHVYSKNLKFLPIPDVPLSKQNQIADYIQKTRTKAKSLQEEAQNILEQAKNEVEQVILGNSIKNDIV
jgi:restriction endonuclease S subunit